jgi:hypothetical protein
MHCANTGSSCWNLWWVELARFSKYSTQDWRCAAVGSRTGMHRSTCRQPTAESSCVLVGSLTRRSRLCSSSSPGDDSFLSPPARQPCGTTVHTCVPVVDSENRRVAICITCSRVHVCLQGTIRSNITLFQEHKRVYP